VPSSTLIGDRLYLRPLEPRDAEALLRLVSENREYFASREPVRTEEYFSLDGQLERIEAVTQMEADERGVDFGIFLPTADELVGHLALFAITRGGFQEARIGYMLAERHSGRGYATEAVKLAVGYAFGELDLHRLETGVQLDNPASARVLAKAGFREEGISLRWVNLADGWADCRRFALTKEEWEG
jgi:[ribosomal protein S5]-alanine N-acetyltransferase